MEFSKLHGLGNDFIMVDCLSGRPTFEDLGPYAVRLCDRHFGIGADGLIVMLPSQVADLRMRLYNSDGSEAEMCGNGIRCFAKYAHDRGNVSRAELSVETGAGIMHLKLETNGGKVTRIRVDMGEPGRLRGDIPMTGPAGQEAIGVPLEADGQRFVGTGVSMGIPHFVILVDDVDSIPLEVVGPKIETHEIFPRKANIDFVQVLDRRHLKMRVWERGAGITLACGTGACASTVAASANGLAEREVTVSLPGGDLMIEWADDNHVYMTGPAEEAFTGVVNLSTR